jgi:hypothetical protein
VRPLSGSRLSTVVWDRSSDWSEVRPSQRFEVIDLCLGQIERLERGKALQRFEVIDICPRQIEITDRRQPG